MSDNKIIQQAIDRVGKEIGKLQGKLFIAEAQSEALRTQIQRLDSVGRNLQTQLQVTPPKTPLTLTAEEIVEILHNHLPTLDPASQAVCVDVLDMLNRGKNPTVSTHAIARMESHAWKQGEAIALAQKVVQFLRS